MNASELRRLYEFLDDCCKAEKSCPECDADLVDNGEADELRGIVKEAWLAKSREETRQP